MLEYASKDNFFTLAKEYLEEIKGESFWTHKQTRVAVNKLKSFYGSDHLPVNHIDGDFLTSFQSHLKKKNKASTIIKNFGCIKNILDIAVRQHLLPKNPMDSETFKLIKKGHVSSKTKLTLDQIQAIEDLDLEPGSNQWHARNAFLLSFNFCGMRFGDLAELRWSNIKDGRLKYDMNKTGNPINLPIKDGAKKILDLYREAEKNRYVFPFLSNLSEQQQKDPATVRKRISSWNTYINGQDSGGKLTGLKAIAKEVGVPMKHSAIADQIPTHVARHSFAQYLVNKDVSI